MTRATRDMEIAFAEGAQLNSDSVGLTRDQVRDGLAAVLAVVERDQRAAAERGWDALRQCPSESPAIPVPPTGEIVLRCEHEAGHSGAHGAMRYLTIWRDQEQATPDSGSNASGVDRG